MNRNGNRRLLQPHRTAQSPCSIPFISHLGVSLHGGLTNASNNPWTRTHTLVTDTPLSSDQMKNEFDTMNSVVYVFSRAITHNENWLRMDTMSREYVKVIPFRFGVRLMAILHSNIQHQIPHPSFANNDWRLILVQQLYKWCNAGCFCLWYG